MKLTDEILKAVMPNAPKARRALFLPFLNEAALRFGITTELRLAAWLATLAVESMELRYTEEIASGAAYEGRDDLGNNQRGDGRKYKGGGLIQWTGRDVYTKGAAYFGEDFVNSPEKVRQPRWACLSAAWFAVVYKNLQPLADKRNFLAYQICVNGRNRKTGLPNHWTERKAYYERALRVIPDNFVLTGDLPKGILTHETPVEVDDEYPDYELTPETGVESSEGGEATKEPAETGKNDSSPVSGENTATSGASSTAGKDVLCKERPSTFVKWLTAIKFGFGAFLASLSAYCGNDEIKTQVVQKGIENVNKDSIPLIGMILLYTAIGVGAGLLLMFAAAFLWDRAARRSKELNEKKIDAAQDPNKTTVDFKN